MQKGKVTTKFAKLFEPIKIGPVEIKNRLAVSPMNGMGDHDGHPTNQYICYFNARALGGFGLLITGAILTNKSAHAETDFKTPALYQADPSMVGYWSEFTDSIRSMGTNTKVFAQLSPGFGRQTGRPNAKAPSPIPVDPEIMRNNFTKAQMSWRNYHLHDYALHCVAVPREMTVEEIHDDERSFVQAAELAIVAGFDGIEIHAPHGYLLSEFLSPRSNQRKDEYGGSLRNRARYLVELVTMCKQNFGDAVPIMFRLSGREYQKDGSTAEDVRQICKWCAEAGADAIDLSNGSGYDDMKHFEPEKDNIELLEAQGKKLREATGIPVITVGLHTPEVALKAVEDGETDIVSLGRQALADPDYPNKLKEGRVDEIVMCTRDNFCDGVGFMGGRGVIRCSQNPNLGREQFIPEYWPKPIKPRVPETLMRWKPGLRWQSAQKH